MRRIFGPRYYLLSLACFLFVAGSCGQGEGGRCQINSDCASGLICYNGTSGNGTCESVIQPVTDASIVPSQTEEAGTSSSLDTGSDVFVGTSVDSSAVDVFTADDAGAESD